MKKNHLKNVWIDFSDKKNFFETKINCHWIKSIIDFLNEWKDNNSFIKVVTSGSTGYPKTIFLKKKYMIHRAIKSVEYLNLNKKNNVKGLLCLSPNFIASKMFLVRAMIFNWKILCVYPSSNPLEKIKNYTFDITSMAPIQSFFSIKYLNNIKNILIGGSKIKDIIKCKLQNIISNCYDVYGLTETYGHIAFKKINGSNKDNYFKSLNDVVIDVDKRNCLKIIFPEMNNIFFQTNDIVKLQSKNSFNVIGRYDNIINTGGIKIIPELLEKKIEPFIKKRRFFISSIPDDFFGEKIILVIEGSFFIIKIPEFFFKKKYLKPKKIFFVSKFKENFIGKIKKIEIINELLLKNE
ncbi:AMP-binding protein [Blattabacterium cuenoti]|uniref:AMP-binding protein n=1 Tax=Blattabacterium cuenoti TaxID=1653831 RepID=UPI00163B8DFA|nr:AMP-binding protein [Blattabacterium cuenoti]